MDSNTVYGVRVSVLLKLMLCWSSSWRSVWLVLVVVSDIWFVGCAWRRDMTVVLAGCHFGTAASVIVKCHCCLHSFIDEA